MKDTNVIEEALSITSPMERLTAFHKLFHLLFDDPEEAFLAATLMSLHAGSALKPERMKEVMFEDGGIVAAAEKRFGKATDLHAKDDADEDGSVESLATADQKLTADEVRLLRMMPRDDLKKAS